MRGILVTLALCAATTAAPAALSPEQHFGHEMGADRRLVGWSDVVDYYQKLDAASDRVAVEQLGRSTEGRPFLLVKVTAPETLERIEDYRRIQKRLADPRATSRSEAEELFRRGKAVVLLTCSIHSAEPASTMSAMEFVYRLATEDTPRIRTILDNTILLVVPSLNPDGVDIVKEWYDRWIGTPYEGAPLTELYHKYAGHDNNRDWYMFTQVETRLTVDQVHNPWQPHIVYDVHQMGTNGARIFVPPWTDPVDPNIDPLIVQQVNAFGTQMATDLTAAGKKGVVVNGIYDYFTPARHYQSYHGGLRLLSEAASVRFATPIRVSFRSLQSDARGYDAQQASWNFPEPWTGGYWTLGDIVDYQLITFESCLYHAALKREDLLRNFYQIQRRAVERESPAAYIIPRRQHDPSALTRLLGTLELGLVEIQQALADFESSGARFHEGDYVVSLRQPFSSFAKTLLERQEYPDIRSYAGGPPRKPYDVTAHSLPLLLGVDVVRADDDFSGRFRLAHSAPEPGALADASAIHFSSDATHSWTAVNRLLKAGSAVYRDDVRGDFYARVSESARPVLLGLGEEFGLSFQAARRDPAAFRRLRAPRIGVYSGFVPIMDEGWTRWVLERYEFPYERLGNARIQEGDLRADFDAVILPDAEPRTLHAGYLEGASYRGARVPPGFSGGIEEEGAETLREFVSEGGILLAFNRASLYAIERLGLPIDNVLDGVSDREFYSPGALLYADLSTTHPLCLGMRPREAVWYEEGPAFRSSGYGEGGRPRTVLRYPDRDVLASGWLNGEEHLANHAAVMDVPVGDGRVILFGIRPQYRGQSNATFKLVFNGLFYRPT